MTDFPNNPKPKYFFDCLTDIKISDLKAMDVKLIAVDLDNTSVYDCTIVPVKGAKEWFQKVMNAGFKVALISNSFKLRGKVMGKIFGCPSYAPADKPSTKCMYEAAKDAGVETSEMALIGDRLFTDMVGANACSAVAVYVKPYTKERLIKFYWKKARQDEIDFLNSINVKRDLKTIYYK